MKNLPDKVALYAKKHGMDLKCRMIVGLSGGSDSVTMLHILKSLGAAPVCIHVNHMIRGDEADRDEDFCRKLCEADNIEFHSYKVDIPALCKSGKKGTEETARDERRRILFFAANEFGCTTVALAHNANDRAETLLFNLARGSGVRGLGSITPKREENGINIIRPILCLTKAEILSYIEEFGLTYVTDSTNADTDYTRNYIRNVLLPSFERVNNAYISNMTTAADNASEADGFITDEALKYLDEHKTAKAADISSLHPALQKKILYLLCEKKCGHAPEAKHLQIICDFTKDCENGKRLQLPFGVDVTADNGCIEFITRTNPAEYHIPLHCGINEINGKDRVIFVEYKTEAEPIETYADIYKTVKRILLSSDTVISDLYVRARKDGDKYVYGNMTHSVKKLLSDKKVPSSLRGDYPVICDKNGILCVPPFSPRDGCKKDGGLFLTYCECFK